MIILKKSTIVFLIILSVFFIHCNNEHKWELAGKKYKKYTDIDPNLIIGNVVTNYCNHDYGVFAGGEKGNDDLWYVFFRHTENFGTEDQISTILDTLIIDYSKYNDTLVLNFMDCRYKNYNYNVVAIYDRYSRSPVRTIAKAWAADTEKKRFVELDPDSVKCMSEYELYGDEPW